MSLRTATVRYEHPNTAHLMQAKERNRVMIVVVGLRRYYGYSTFTVHVMVLFSTKFMPAIPFLITGKVRYVISHHQLSS